ncbi:MULTISPECIES: hypothetical protein [unclassified Corynebacterium]|uniref:hypothetical protein n=1 Tax=unclassified Corynebacterium TaxID=2624378 RepID=UPI00264FCF3C|nr:MULTISPECIES: hypothetical protein [unclassified Corynebacterium]MDN8594649.1 hypothetical protein [Corynebacterium sp. P4_F2]WKK56145.1 hypothetical protein QYR03_02700 [Corynebacterium sp. P4-C1]WKK63557.1 hypothetical protein QYR04_01195 [Corynebacterium sp. P8-C1]
MVLRVGKPPSAGAWLFFDRAFETASQDPDRFSQPNPFEDSRRFEEERAKRMHLMKFDLALLGAFCALMLVVNIVGRIVVAGWGRWLVLGLGIVAGLAAVGFFFWFRFRLRNNLAHLAGNLDALTRW